MNRVWTWTWKYQKGLIGAGGVDFSCRVLQMSHNYLFTSLCSVSLIIWSKLPMCWGKVITHTMVWAPLHLQLWLSAKKVASNISHLSQVSSSCWHSNSFTLRSWTGISAQDHWLPPLLSSHLQWLLCPSSDCITIYLNLLLVGSAADSKGSDVVVELANLMGCNCLD